MIVLEIIGGLLVLFLLYGATLEIDKYSQKVYAYEFFTTDNLVIAIIGYALLFGGFLWYKDALGDHGDTLNGIVLMFIGLPFIVALIYKNLKATSLIFGTLATIFQLIVFAASTVFILYGVLLLMAWLSDTKPVYEINEE